MFEKLNNLETGLIRGKEIKNLLEILQQNYFDKVMKEDYSIIYNYKNFHSKYGSLLNASIDELRNVLEEMQTSFNDLWNDYKDSKEGTK